MKENVFVLHSIRVYMDGDGIASVLPLFYVIRKDAARPTFHVKYKTESTTEKLRSLHFQAQDDPITNKERHFMLSGITRCVGPAAIVLSYVCFNLYHWSESSFAFPLHRAPHMTLRPDLCLRVQVCCVWLWPHLIPFSGPPFRSPPLPDLTPCLT